MEGKEEIISTDLFENTQITNNFGEAFLSKENFIDQTEFSEINNKIVGLKDRINTDKIDALDFETNKCSGCSTYNYNINCRCYICSTEFDKCELTGLNLLNKSDNDLVTCGYCDKKFIKKMIGLFWKVFDYCPFCLNQVEIS